MGAIAQLNLPFLNERLPSRAGLSLFLKGEQIDYADLYMFWPRPFPLQRRRFKSFNLMS